MALVNLLSTGPGVFVYHLLILLVLEALVGITLVEWRRAHNPDQRRFLWVFGGLVGMHVLLLHGEPLGPAIIAPLLNGIELTSLTLMGWAFLAPLSRRASRGYLLSGLGVAALCVVTFLPGWYKALAQFPHLLYLTFWQQTFWCGVSTLMALIPALTLWRLQRREKPWLTIFGFTALFLGFATVCAGSLFLTIRWFGLSAYTLIGVGRLINMLGYPLFPIAVHRTALRDKQTQRRPLQNTSGDMPHQIQELQFLLETSRTISESPDLDVVLQRVVESTATALGADRCAIFLANTDEPGTVNLAAQYAPLQGTQQPTTQPAFPLSEQPTLAHALERRKPLTTNVETNTSHLRVLYRLLGSPEAGPTIVQPLLNHRRILGALVVGNDRSQRTFEPHQVRLCQSIAAQFSGAIENARLYHDLETQLVDW